MDDLMPSLEAVAEELVLLEASDLQGLASLHTSISAFADKSDGVVVAVSKACADYIESIILGEVEDAGEALGVVGDALGMLQSVIRGYANSAELNWPEVLKVQLPSGREPEAVSTPNDAPPFTLPANVESKVFDEFLAAQVGVIEDMEEHILTLENKNDQETLHALKRLIHTLKGESGLLGLDQVEALCHHLEDLLEQGFSKSHTDHFLQARDWLRNTFDGITGKCPMPCHIDKFIGKSTTSSVAEKTPAAAPVVPPPAGPTQEGNKVTLDGPLRSIINPDEVDHSLLAEFVSEAMEHLDTADVHLLTLEGNPQNKDSLNAVFRIFHTVKGVAGFLGLEEISRLSHETENLLDRVRKGQLPFGPTMLDVVFSCVDALKYMIEGTQSFLSSGVLPKPFEAIVPLLQRVVDAAAGKAEPQPATGTTTIAPSPAYDDATSDDPGMAAGGEAPTRSVAGASVRETLRVDSERLDQLVDTIGELVIAESMVGQMIQNGESNTAALNRHMGHLGKITRELQEIGMSLRMVPVRATFQKMARLVRDLSRKSGKSVDFQMSGEETELDKSLVDRIGDPLVHMVRNSVDHGIEASAEERELIGKPPKARVELRAYHKGGSICIEILDDGRGLDRDAILKKAVERGLVEKPENMTDREVWGLIFEPGFSTAEKVTDISGRGVGMDVVKRNVEALRGHIDIDSVTNKGTSFTIRLPLTLAIIDGMVVRVGDEKYIVPTLGIVRTVHPQADDISTVVGRGEMLQQQGRLIPLTRLGGLFEIASAKKNLTDALIIIVEDEARQVGLVVDELLGKQQTVIKSLGEGLREIPGISGGAIMPDGMVGLIIDVSGLIRLAHAGDAEQAPEGIASSVEN